MNGGIEPSRRGQTPSEPVSGPPGAALSILLLFGFLAFVFVFAATAGFVTSNNVDGWYETIRKPALTPANWVFPVVWNFLYFLMGLSGWLIWRSAGSFPAAGAPLAIFAAQVMLNFTWSVIFFGMHSTAGAAIEIFALLAAILATIFAFWRINRLAAALLFPYLAWVLFATYLSLAVWLLNR
ncbi:TspO/MBR family protein [Parvibaculum sp.]|uniref:TspO/MBR family protein n=1 Tax=Parvibaculum sp. TaxID=2024848 RepID=UPI002B9E1189|nr:TspO/MBR family protein [Parvibaculum sp.]HUD50160.1 TspO/MBR family protein [Parvibaculum sp.]